MVTLASLNLNQCSDARSLNYYLDCDEKFLQKKETLTKEEWKEFKKRSGASFVYTCSKIHLWYSSLSESQQDDLKTISFPSYLPLAAVVNLSKIPADALLECSGQLKIRADEQGYLNAKDVSTIAKTFHSKPKGYLILEEEMTLDGWQIVAKKYKLKNPEDLAAIQQKAQEMAWHETVFTAHAVEALSELGYDPSLVLPKLKKQYTEKDVEKAVEPLRLENTALKERIQELEQSKDTQIVNLIQEEINQVEEPSIQIEEPEVQKSAELQALLSIIEPEQAIPTAPEIDKSKIFPKAEITSLKDFKGCRAITLFDGEWKSGELGSQNGTRHTIQFRKAEDGKIYTFDFSQVQVEHGDRFRLLNELIKELGLTVEDRNPAQLQLEIEERKAQKFAEKTKGFGFSPTTRTHSHRSQGYNPMGKKAGAR